jgi:3-oxoadipate enol-lactonase
MHHLHVHDVDLSVSDQGAGIPVVLVHGFPLNRHMWDEATAVLAARCRVIAPDLRGFGTSGVTSGKVTVDQFADDLAAMLDALAVREPVVLAGLSMGGYIAFRFFQKHRARLRGLVLCDTRAAADTPDVARGRLETADRVERAGPDMLADMMIPRMLSPVTFQNRPDLVRRVEQMILSGSAQGLAAAARGLAERPDFTELAPRIDCPTLLVVGRQDAISTPAEMRSLARAIPGARLVEIDAAGHMAPMEKPIETAAAIEEFVTEVGRSTGS